MNSVIGVDEGPENIFIAERDQQLALFGQYLSEGIADGKRIWNIYGTAGIGKSFLMDAYRRMALRAGALMLFLDSRDFNHTADQFCRRLLRQVQQVGRADAPASLPEGETDALEACLNALLQISASAKVVVALDTYEEMGELDGWLRERFFKQLPPDVLLLLAGRYKLKDQWIVAPALREQIRYMPLGHLSDAACDAYLRHSGILDDEQVARIRLKTHGHPLALSLSAFIGTQADWSGDGTDEAEWFDHLAKAWLREVPDARLRQLVEAAAVLLHVNREVLQYIMDKEIDDEAFERLIGLSFVRRTDRGWMLHDLVRGAMRKQLEERTPAYYEKLRSRAAHYFAARIRHSSAYRNTEWEVGELFYYTGGGLVRASIQAQARGRYAWETLTSDNADEGERYLSRRRGAATPLTLTLVDPDTAVRYDNFEGEEAMTLAVKDLDLRAWIALDSRSVMLLRSADGEAVGLAAIIPIHAKTLAYLRGDPFAGPYLSSLTPDEYRRLEVAPPGQAGWFIRSIDFVDWSRPDLAIEAMFLMFSYMCAGGLFVASPPPAPFFGEVHRTLGFQAVPGLLHRNYDGRTPTPTFVLDTRGEKLEAFLAFLLKRGGFPEETTITAAGGLDERLTEREREVAALVLDGMTNAEIAAELFVSEITVKKHVSSIYGKLSVKGRGQLIKLLVGKSGRVAQ
ncbi:LuxR C-terminal-related transcriptional regulator [Cohnella cellulosilytica]|uniref:LuxR C-terminal-related transcriptional regulator n=1 Tax=Cohnella cellulosilytica TaxID=986710 RepID=A0ABW2FFQ8_9BACL